MWSAIDIPEEKDAGFQSFCDPPTSIYARACARGYEGMRAVYACTRWSFEKSTATSGVSARVCIKRKSRSNSLSPRSPHRRPRSTSSHFLPFSFSIRDIFPANNGDRAGRACFAFCTCNFASTIFHATPFPRLLESRLHSPIGQTSNARTTRVLCVVRRNVGSPPQILLFPSWHEVLRANLYGKQYVDGIESTIRRNGAWNSVPCYLKLYPCIMTSECFSIPCTVDDFFQSTFSIFQ